MGVSHISQRKKSMHSFFDPLFFSMLFFMTTPPFFVPSFLSCFAVTCM